MNAPATELLRQHLIDPEVCIRCNTCEETCPVGAITHDSRNYVVLADKCKACLACISPCPTGAIDNWRNVLRAEAYSIDEQFGWDELPAERSLGLEAAAAPAPQVAADAAPPLAAPIAAPVAPRPTTAPPAAPAAAPIDALVRKLDSDFFAGRWENLTNRQRDLLRCAAPLPHADEEFTIRRGAISSKSR